MGLVLDSLMRLFDRNKQKKLSFEENEKKNFWDKKFFEKVLKNTFSEIEWKGKIKVLSFSEKFSNGKLNWISNHN